MKHYLIERNDASGARMRAELDAFFLGGGSICPYARAAAREGSLLYITPDPDGDIHAQIAEGVRTYAEDATRSAAILVPYEQPATHAQAAQLAKAYFGALATACVLRGNPSMEFREAMEVVRDQVTPFLEPSAEIRPLLGVADRLLDCIAMSPHYDPAHPRYAPHFLLFFIWHDLVEGPGVPLAIRDRIRALMQERTGEVYDALELYLPDELSVGSRQSSALPPKT